MFFSRRNSLVPKKPLQLDDADDALRSGLWSVLVEHVWKTFRPRDPLQRAGSLVAQSNLEPLLMRYWVELYKLPTDTIPSHFNPAIDVVRKEFFDGLWHGVFDLLECTLQVADQRTAAVLCAEFNRALERENSGYRLVGDHVVAITNSSELDEVQDATESIARGAAAHVQAAIALFSNRNNPDYRNVIKESISAVESVCRLLTGQPNITLGQALNSLQPKLKLHNALKSGLASMYGYTSDDSGIRHAMLEPTTVSSAEAKFMLVACSAFVNFLTSKASEAGVVPAGTEREI